MDGRIEWDVVLGGPGPGGEVLARRVIERATARGGLPPDASAFEGGAVGALSGWLGSGGLTHAQLDELVRELSGEEVACPSCGDREPGVRQVDARDLVRASSGAGVEVFGELPAERLGRYELRRQVGRGGMGIVLEGWDASLERSVAIKVLRRGEDAKARARLEREAVVVASLRHPNIIPVHEVALAGEDDVALSYLVMDFVDGPSLAEALPGMSRERVLDVAIQVTEALGYAHAKGVIHRDIKPANVLMQGEMAMVVDFGLARSVDDVELRTGSGVAVGTLAYMSPEQLEGRRELVDPRSDVWSLGVSLYEMLTGRLPFEGRTAVEVMHRILSEDAVPPRRRSSGVARDLEAICLKALERDRGRRYEDAGAMSADLRRFRDGEPVLARPPGRVRRAYRALSRRPMAVMGALCVVLVALAVGLVWWSAERRHEDLRKLAQAALDRGDWDECVAACRQALVFRDDEELVGWAERGERERGARAERNRVADERRGFLDRLGASTALIEATRPYFYIPDYDIAARVDAIHAELASLTPLAGDPRYAGESRLHAVLGIGWLMVDDHETAMGYLQRALELDPSDAFIHRELGRLYLLRGVRDVLLTTTTSGFEAARAKPHLDAAEAGGYEVGLERDEVVALEWVARFDAEAARRACEAGLERHAGEIGSEMFQVLLGGLTEDREARQALFESALRLRPHFAWLMLGLAQSIPYGQLDRKMNYAFAAEKINRRLIGVNKVIAQCYSRLGMLHTADVRFRNEIELISSSGIRGDKLVDTYIEYLNYCWNVIGKNARELYVRAAWKAVIGGNVSINYIDKMRCVDALFTISMMNRDYIAMSICRVILEGMIPVGDYYRFRLVYMYSKLMDCKQLRAHVECLAAHEVSSMTLVTEARALVCLYDGQPEAIRHYDKLIAEDDSNLNLWHKKIDALYDLDLKAEMIEFAMKARKKFRCRFGSVFDRNIIACLESICDIRMANRVIGEVLQADCTDGDRLFACRVLLLFGCIDRCAELFRLVKVDTDTPDDVAVRGLHSSIAYVVGRHLALQRTDGGLSDDFGIKSCDAAIERCIEILSTGEYGDLFSVGALLADNRMMKYFGVLFMIVHVARTGNCEKIAEIARLSKVLRVGNQFVARISAVVETHLSQGSTSETLSALSGIITEYASRTPKFEFFVSCWLYGICSRGSNVAEVMLLYEKAIRTYKERRFDGDYRTELALISKEFACLLYRSGLTVRAFELIKSSIELLPQSYGGKRELILMLLKSDRFAEAIVSINKTFSHEIRLGELLVLRGRAYQRLGNVLVAEHNFRLACEVLPLVAASGYVKNDASKFIAMSIASTESSSLRIHSVIVFDGDRKAVVYYEKGRAFSARSNYRCAAVLYRKAVECGLPSKLLVREAIERSNSGERTHAKEILDVARTYASVDELNQIDRLMKELSGR